MVTGGGSGMGRAIVHRLARDGFAVAVLELDTSAAETVAKEVRAGGGEALAVGGVDVSDRAQVDEGMRRARQAFGPLLVLVNNAGITGFRDFADITDEKWDRMMAVNLHGPFHCTQAVLPDMVDAGWGRIVNISSSSAQRGQPYMVHHVTSKAGLIGFTKALALELGPKGITVNTIPPGFIDTPMLRESERRGVLGGSVREHAALTPVRRAGRSEDIAAACAFLVSDEAGYVTGQVVGVNGGRNT
ncbi:NAD(P)-dependent dehydrogenase, short-chain alcohol dehydrogenase family [Streptomyces sp. yr375]|uniref:SDR family NAD(P)-dependent oxidoreductase n=1 Tax=Streptomyces sp. yr375 TaxID=1761906 RepID=UPI0008B475D1|nr:SDR family NAD(P)-dependent oxidoreductase [Streptomyces sp. yr375]SEQ00099.1 NAD(P)-dependent dehydrogenase, short-chain alcohol dehydrogenase family [Streptomyces sp. yr375]